MRNKKLENPRNGGRRKIADAVLVQIKVPKQNVKKLKEFAKTLVIYEDRKTTPAG